MPFAERFLLIANPKAGAGRAGRNLGALQTALSNAGATFDVQTTSSRGEATTLVRKALADGVRGVGVVGGDGTLNEAINGFFDERGAALPTSAWFAPFPAGTGGDFCRSLRIPTKIEAMVAHITRANARPIDLGWAEYTLENGEKEGRAFLNIASFGLSAVVDRAIERLPKQIGGRATYFVGALLGMTRYKPAPIAVSVDGEIERETEALTFAIANAEFFGGGMHIAPGALIDDGLLDIVGLEHVSKLRSIAMSSAIYSGRILSEPGITHRRARRFAARTLDPAVRIHVEMDGEAPGQLPATFEVRPRALLLRA